MVYRAFCARTVKIATRINLLENHKPQETLLFFSFLPILNILLENLNKKEKENEPRPSSARFPSPTQKHWNTSY